MTRPVEAFFPSVFTTPACISWSTLFLRLWHYQLTVQNISIKNTMFQLQRIPKQNNFFSSRLHPWSWFASDFWLLACKIKTDGSVSKVGDYSAITASTTISGSTVWWLLRPYCLQGNPERKYAFWCWHPLRWTMSKSSLWSLSSQWAICTSGCLKLDNHLRQQWLIWSKLLTIEVWLEVMVERPQPTTPFDTVVMLCFTHSPASICNHNMWPDLKKPPYCPFYESLVSYIFENLYHRANLPPSLRQIARFAL